MDMTIYIHQLIVASPYLLDHNIKRCFISSFEDFTGKIIENTYGLLMLMFERLSYFLFLNMYFVNIIDVGNKNKIDI